MFFKIRVLKNFAIFTGKHLCWSLFLLIAMVYDRVGDADKFSKGNFGLGRPRFHATSHLKIEPKVVFS